MPTTRVAKSSGATMVRISRRKIWLSTRRFAATPGKVVADLGAQHDRHQDPSGERLAAAREHQQRDDHRPAGDGEEVEGVGGHECERKCRLY